MNSGSVTFRMVCLCIQEKLAEVSKYEEAEGYADWPEHADCIEDELWARHEAYSPLAG